MSGPNLNPNKLAYRVDEAADAIGVSRSTIYELVRAGELELGKIAGRSVIKRDQIEAYFSRHYQTAGSLKGAASRAA